MQPSVLPSTTTTFPVDRAPMVHVSTSLDRFKHGSTKKTTRKSLQYIGSPDWLDWGRPPSLIPFASYSTKFTSHSHPSFAHSSLTARTPSCLSPLCAATSQKNITLTRPILRWFWRQTSRPFTQALLTGSEGYDGFWLGSREDACRKQRACNNFNIEQVLAAV